MALARPFLLPVVALLALPLAGCPVLDRLSGNATIDLSRAQLRRMNVQLRKAEQTVCPREQVQLGIFLTAVPENGKDEKTFETWVGRGAVNKNDRLAFTDFSFETAQGQVDKDGWLAPQGELQATAGQEIAVKVTYNPSPLVYSSTYKWKPDYACITEASSPVEAGAAGGVGKDGATGKPGDGGGVMSAGGDGHDGAAGGAGVDGAPGSAGAKVHAVVTYVKTPFYDKLLAVRLTGGINDLLLVVPGHPFVIHANGGQGGAGGPGGKGGTGAVGSSGNPGGHGGNGGVGGTGGRGGAGGAGGAIDLTYDSHFPDLAGQITVDVTGGKGGEGGPGGPGGDPGAAGKGVTPPNTPTTPVDGARGNPGGPGPLGAAGHVGQNGVASARSGPIGDAFAGLKDITVLTSPPAPHPAH
jgi:hypothetical protein